MRIAFIYVCLAIAVAGEVAAGERAQAQPGHAHEHVATPKPAKQPAPAPDRSESAGAGDARPDTGHGSMQGGSPPPDARDPHAYSGGYGFGALPRMHMGDEHNFASLLVDRLETRHSRRNSAKEYDLQAWYGRDYDRAVLKSEGEIDGGRLHEARTELLWGHAFAAFWDAQLGLRYDSNDEGPDRRWLVIGAQGLAPYWFEIDAAAYIGESGRTALRVEAEYELLLTQRLILQPRLELNAYGKRDSALGLGSGISNVTAGVRLRYELRRAFAPYVGVERSQRYGGTADFARRADRDTGATHYVAGVRFWF